MLPKRIDTLEEIYAQQAKLKRQMDFTKHEFVRSVNHTSHEGRDFLLKKVLLPASIAGLTAMAAKQVFSSRQKGNTYNGSSQYGRPEKAPYRSANLFFKLLPIVMPLIQQYVFQKTVKEEVIPEVKNEENAYRNANRNPQNTF